jgi:hypothetical protein
MITKIRETRIARVPVTQNARVHEAVGKVR